MITKEEEREQLKKFIIGKITRTVSFGGASNEYETEQSSITDPGMLADLLIDLLGGELKITFKNKKE